MRSAPPASTAWPSLASLARTGVTEAGVAPASVLAIGGLGPSGWRFACSAAGVRSRTLSGALDESTPFDLASVTKPIVACTVARLIRRATLDWRTPLGAVIPELEDSSSGGASLELLLSHRAGLSAHAPLYAPLLSGRPMDRAVALREAAEARRPSCLGSPPEEGFPPLYSDLGYILVGEMASRAAGVDLATLVEREVSGPLGLDAAPTSTWAERDAQFFDRVAPTEVVPFRGGEIVGLVHDENAWALTGLGLSGHAGLFATGSSVARFGAAVVDALAGRLPEWLEPVEVTPLVRERPGGTLRAGFDGRSDDGSSAGRLFGRRAFGHLGFTGTSLWCDPDAAVVAVILTNRISPSRDNLSIRQARPPVNDALFQAAVALGRS